MRNSSGAQYAKSLLHEGRVARVPAHLQPLHEPEQPVRTRYADQPMSAQTRFVGVAGVTLVGLLIAGAALIRWTTYAPVQAPTSISVFDVASPESPPEPETEEPPVEEQPPRPEAQSQPEPVQVTQPNIPIARANPIIPPAARNLPDPKPAVETRPKPESNQPPPAPRQSDAAPTWQGKVLTALNRAKRYPRAASARRQQGVPYIRFVMDREGKVLSVQLERTSGFRVLDEAALALPKRAQPLPPPPDEIEGETIELVVPVEFFMRS